MAKGTRKSGGPSNPNPSPATRFRPGQSGNPKGIRPKDVTLSKLRRLTAPRLEDLVSLLFDKTPAEVQAVIDNAQSKTLEVACARAIKVASDTGDMRQLDPILNRVIGKVREQVDLTVTKPSILVRRNGDEVVFTNTPIGEGEEE